MNEYINREDALDAVLFALVGTGQQSKAITAIRELPTADAVEVRHGHWIEHIEKPSWLEDDVEVYYDCSECGTSHWSIMPPYCPECGAKMDGERSENDNS